MRRERRLPARNGLLFSRSHSLATLVLMVSMAVVGSSEARAEPPDSSQSPPPEETEAPVGDATTVTPALPGASQPAPESEMVELPSSVLDSEQDSQEDLAAPAGDLDEGTAEDVSDYMDLSLEELLNIPVVTATRAEQRLQDAPAIVTVIVRAQIRAWGYSSLAEVLRHVVGFYVIDDHILPNVVVRGVSGGLRAESGLIKVMVNGQSVAFRSTGGNWLGPELIPMSAIERIEIIRGPASALYGADAFLATINIITRRGSDVDGVNFALDGGYVGNRLAGSLDMAVGAKNGPLEILVAGRLHREDRSGIKLPASSPAPRLPEYSADNPRASGLRHQSTVGFLSTTYHFSDRNRLDLSAYVSALDRGGEFFDLTPLAHGLDSQGRFNENRTSLQQGFVNTSVSLGLGDDVDLSFEATLFAGAPTRRDRTEVGSSVFYIRRQSGFRGMELELSAQWRQSENLSVLCGVGWIIDEEKLPSNEQVLKIATADRRAGQTRVEGSSLNEKLTLHNPAAHLQIVWSPLAPYLGLTAGVRYDYHSIYGNQVSGRFGAVSTPSEDLSIKLLYGNAFKAPSVLLLHAEPLRPGDIIGNSSLKPQRIHTIEGQVLYKATEHLSIAAGVAYNTLANKAEFTQQGVNQIARNMTRVNGLSLEGEITADLIAGLHSYLNVSWQYTVREIGEEGYRAQLLGDTNVLAPDLMANAGVQYELPWLPLRAGVEGSYVSPRRASDSNILENGVPYELDSYFLLGAVVSWMGLDLFEERKTIVRLIGRNLLDIKGPEPGFGGIDYPLVPRTLVLQVNQEI